MTVQCISVLPNATVLQFTVKSVQKPFPLSKVGQAVSSEIHCSHEVLIFERILWYKQDKDRAPQFLGYLNLNSPYPEEDVKGKISFNGNGKKYSNLTISNVSVTDSAVYFCAASQHSTTDSTEVNTKTSPNVYETD
uniref:Ig-like domain-containing protein n=1 Tax=Oreochromis aureus TaxID=47969 RepID=A0A668RB45_OREAU